MKYKNLILSGGGVRGIYYLSLLKYIEEQHYNLHTIKNIVGTSIGSFVAMAISIGYTSEELKPYLINVLDYSKVKTLDIFNFLQNLGLDDGSKLNHFIKKMIRDKIGRKDITFLQLYKLFNKNLIVNTVCLETKKIIYLSKSNSPHIKIWKAIRMSMSVPILFKPYGYKEFHYVDGGIKDYFPIEMFSSRETLGVDVCLSLKSTKSNTMNIEDYIICLIDIVTRNSSEIKDQDIILLESSYDSNNHLLSFQPKLDEKIISESLEYSYKAICQYFVLREKDIYDFCASIIVNSIYSIN